jgi:hypothetical protein
MLIGENVGTTFGDLSDSQDDVDHDRVETEEAGRSTHHFTLMSAVNVHECM